MEKHEIHENWPQLNVTQHFATAHSISRQDVENSVTTEFEAEHTYDYERPFWLKKVITNFMRAGKRVLMPSSRPSGSRSPASSVLSSQSPLHLESSSVMLSSTYTPSNSENDINYDFPVPPVNEASGRVSRPAFPLPILNASQGTTTDIKGEKEEEGKDDDNYESIYDLPKLPENDVSYRPRLRSVSLPPLPLTTYLPKETTDAKQKEEQGNGDDYYDDTYEGPKLPVDEVSCRPRPRSISLPPIPLPTAYSPQESMTDVKNEKGNDHDKYDDVCDRQRRSDIPSNPDQECDVPKAEPQTNSMSGESYQELSLTTDDGYTPLVRDLQEGVNEQDMLAVPNTSAHYMNMAVSGDDKDTKHTTYYQPVFYMNL